ncbi:MAG: DMT family transporter [Hyphomicrobiaceae bacterium]
MHRHLPFEFVLVVALGVFWGLNWPTVKLLLAELAPWTLRGLGLSLGAIGLAGIALVMRQSLRPRRDEVTPLVVTGLLSILGFNILTAFGQLLTETSTAVIVAFTMPMWAAILSVLVLGERLTLNRILSLVVGMLGLLVLVSGDITSFAQAPAGPCFMLGAALSWAAGTVALKARTWSIGPVARATWMVGVSAPVTVLGALAFEDPLAMAPASAEALWLLAYHIVFPMVVCHAVWVSLVGRLPASVAAIGTLLIPVVGVASAAVVLGDVLGPSKLAALALILISVILTFWRFDASSQSFVKSKPSG